MLSLRKVECTQINLRKAKMGLTLHKALCVNYDLRKNFWHDFLLIKNCKKISSDLIFRRDFEQSEESNQLHFNGLISCTMKMILLPTNKFVGSGMYTK
jgi:hypothetical protein